MSPVAFDNGSSTETPSPSKRALQPSDILKLSEDSQLRINDVRFREVETFQLNIGSTSKLPSQSNDIVPKGYVIPQKRIAQLKSHDVAPNTSAKYLSNSCGRFYENQLRKEKMVGGLSKEDELRSIWAKLDEEERRQKFRPTSQTGNGVVSDNDVLGAWEDEAMLHDLSRVEGDW
jgi:hypothetical protein